MLFQKSQTGESALLRRLKARDPKAMAELYDRYGGPAYSLILRIVLVVPVAEDLLQETLLCVWNQAHAIDAEDGALGAWILAVARKRAVRHLRSVDGRMRSSTVELPELESPKNFSGLEVNAALPGRLHNAIAKLTPRQHQVIEMAYYEGMSQTEIADRLRQPLDAVKTWTQEALRILRGEPEAAAV